MPGFRTPWKVTRGFPTHSLTEIQSWKVVSEVSRVLFDRPEPDGIEVMAYRLEALPSLRLSSHDR